MKLRFLATLGLALIGMVALVRATEQPAPVQQSTPESVAGIRDELILKQQALATQFDEFQTNILKLKQRFERGTDEEKKRAAHLGRILLKAQEFNIRTELDQLADDLRKSKLTNATEVNELKERSVRLTGKLQELIAMFTEDPRLAQLNADTKAIRDFLKTVEGLINKQKQNQGLTEAGKSDPKDLSKNQGTISKGIDNLGKAIDDFLGKKGGDPSPEDLNKLKGTDKPGGEGNQAKATPKNEGDQPQGDSPGKAKDDAGDPKGGQGTAKAGDPKEGDPKGGGEAQAKDKGGDPKAGDMSGAKAGDPKSGDSTAKPGDPKAGDSTAKPGDPKGGDPKGGQASAKPNGDPKGGDPKGGQASSKPGDPKGGDPKSAQASSKDSKGGEAGSQAKPGQTPPKSGEGSKGGQGQAKPGEAKSASASKSDGAGKGGQPPPPGGQASAKNDPNQGDPKGPPPGGNPPPGDSKTKDQIAQNKKQIQEAGYDSKKAEQKLNDNKPKEAIPPEDDVIKNLDNFKKKLEDLLRQTREEELERLLAQLEARCKKMLEMQIAVLNGTETTHKAVLSRVDKKPSREDQKASLGLSDNEKDIISEANKAIQLLEEEGTAVAFPEVFQQVREDMKHAQRRLESSDVGVVTQAIEKDIIETLKEMIEALQKAQKDLDKSKGKPKDGQPGPPPDQKLLDKIAELKMIRSLQKRVNDRTQFYGRLFPNEQALDPELRKQLQDLGQRQERIFEIMDRFVKGDGK